MLGREEEGNRERTEIERRRIKEKKRTEMYANRHRRGRKNIKRVVNNEIKIRERKREGDEEEKKNHLENEKL